MFLLTISEVAQKVGLRPSAIRYYEQIGVIHPAHRVSGQRRYDDAALYRLATLQRARHIGFTLDEVRQLFVGFPYDTPPSERWRKLSQRKLAELEQLVNGIKAIQRLLQGQGQCGCVSLEECGKGLLRSGGGDALGKARPANRRRNSMPPNAVGTRQALPAAAHRRTTTR